MATTGRAQAQGSSSEGRDMRIENYGLIGDLSLLRAALPTAVALATLKSEAEAGAWEPRVVACFAEIVRDASLRNGTVLVEQLEQGR